MVEEVKPEIVKTHHYGTYVQETGRLLKLFIGDMKRTKHCIKNNLAAPIDSDIVRLAEGLEGLTIELEQMLAYKFPKEIDCTAEELKRFYNIG